MKRITVIVAALAAISLSAWGQGATPCEQAWADYNAFRARTVMEPNQYPLTEYGARVRAACGAEALPVPPGSDTPHRPIVRKPAKPPAPPPPAPATPQPPKPQPPAR
ncbi:MAG: hypothetical protein ACK4MJ_12390 [Hylemonella sp.]